jgi:ABC-type transport system involved in cytochrome c biogenesis permease subunit
MMLYIHPPLAVAAYFFVFLFASLQFLKNKNEKLKRYVGLASWTLTFFGLVSGMLWAQIGWGTYWSWDPKEDATLILLIAVSFSVIMSFEKSKYSKAAAVLACVLSLVTVLTSFVFPGLHSFF